ncbi:ComEA family DNA-binding protein [Paenibacillus aestuarii]|uniref:Helix-hairpin-helix domain-containing protein n=1 Tax=Paenibacillus aestuarii TaxID=516965 RepID=A0ABW0KAC8_9BACL|nr:helix-hairpin-helix domain-containing protein [Paenibacillus aestuarii]
MILFVKKGRWYLLGAVLACLFGYVLWQFALGGRTWLQTEFQPVNSSMQQLIDGQNKPQAAAQASPRQESSAASSPSVQPPESRGLPAVSPSSIPAASLQTAAPLTAQPPAGQQTAAPKANNSDTKTETRLDLNTATAEQLDALPGIGPSKAQAIVEHRTKKGKFQRVEQLLEVKGIGAKMLEKLKPLVYVATT